MTATAFAYEPHVDSAFDLELEPATVPGVQRPVADLVPARPPLRLISGSGQTAPTAEPVSVEVYRRRRFIALVALTVAALVVAQLAGLSLTAFNPTAQPDGVTVAPAVHVVLPGDSYAAIAAGFGAENPAVAAAALQAANGGAELSVGQRVVIDLEALDLGTSG